MLSLYLTSFFISLSARLPLFFLNIYYNSFRESRRDTSRGDLIISFTPNTSFIHQLALPPPFPSSSSDSPVFIIFFFNFFFVFYYPSAFLFKLWHKKNDKNNLGNKRKWTRVNWRHACYNREEWLPYSVIRYVSIDRVFFLYWRKIIIYTCQSEILLHIFFPSIVACIVNWSACNWILSIFRFILKFVCFRLADSCNLKRIHPKDCFGLVWLV